MNQHVIHIILFKFTYIQKCILYTNLFLYITSHCPRSLPSLPINATFGDPYLSLSHFLSIPLMENHHPIASSSQGYKSLFLFNFYSFFFLFDFSYIQALRIKFGLIFVIDSDLYIKLGLITNIEFSSNRIYLDLSYFRFVMLIY